MHIHDPDAWLAEHGPIGLTGDAATDWLDQNAYQCYECCRYFTTAADTGMTECFICEEEREARETDDEPSFHSDVREHGTWNRGMGL